MSCEWILIFSLSSAPGLAALAIEEGSASVTGFDDGLSAGVASSVSSSENVMSVLASSESFLF